MNLANPTIAETQEFFEQNREKLVFCEPNEFAHFGGSSERQFGGTAKLDCCSALFLWQPESKKSVVFHLHGKTDWGKTANLVQELCKDGSWQLTPAAGKTHEHGAFHQIEHIGRQIEEKSNARIKLQDTVKTENRNDNSQAQQSYVAGLNSYCMDSQTGKIQRLNAAAIEGYENSGLYSDVFGRNSSRAYVGGFQYITRTGTVPVCSFDGKNHTGAASQLENTPEMHDVWKRCGDIFVDSILSSNERDEFLRIAKMKPEQKAQALGSLMQREPLTAKENMISEIIKPKSGILPAGFYQNCDDATLRLCANGVWQGFASNFNEHAPRILQQHLDSVYNDAKSGIESANSLPASSMSSSKKSLPSVTARP